MKTVYLLLVWFGVVLALALAGVFDVPDGRPPLAVLLAVVAPILLYVIDRSFLNGVLFEVVHKMENSTAIFAQTLRVIGGVFLIEYFMGRLPSGFALPAGLGDVAIGLAAPWVTWALTTKKEYAGKVAWLWNCLGIFDLVLAMAMGVTHGAPPLGVFAQNTSMRPINVYPLILIPAWIVPVAIILHLRSLQCLRQAGTHPGIMELAGTVKPSTHAAYVHKTRIREALLSGPILATLMKLGWPTIIVLVVQTLVGVAETYWVGFLGTAALAGVTLVFPVSMLMTMMSNGGIGGGVASAVARAIGAGRRQDADALVAHALILAVGFGLLFTGGMLLTAPVLYHALGGEGASLDAAVKYSTWLFIGSVPVWIMNLTAAALRGAGNVRTPALVSMVGAMIMIPLSPAFIFGFGPIPRFGIAGAGIAVTIYYVLADIVLLYYLASGRSGLVLKRVRIEARLFRDILRVGLISAVGTIQPNLTVVVVTGVVGLFGASALAGYGIASRLDYVLIPIMFGLGTSVVTMVGTNMGAGNLTRAKRVAWTGAFLGLAVTGIIGTVAAIAPTLWIHLFSHDQGVIATGSLYLHIVAPVYGAVGVAMLLYFAAQGGGQVLWPFLGGTARLVIAAGIGWLAVARWGFGLPILFAIVAAAVVVSAAISVMATLSGAIWRTGSE